MFSLCGKLENLRNTDGRCMVDLNTHRVRKSSANYLPGDSMVEEPGKFLYYEKNRLWLLHQGKESKI